MGLLYLFMWEGEFVFSSFLWKPDSGTPERRPRALVDPPVESIFALKMNEKRAK